MIMLPIGLMYGFGKGEIRTEVKLLFIWAVSLRAGLDPGPREALILDENTPSS